MAAKSRCAASQALAESGRRAGVVTSEEYLMRKKVWQAPKVETTPVSMEVTMYLPAQA
jgi:coenzyme PQQ precursor peptide PqqA